MQLRNTTKMAYQAALAIFIAELISWYFHMNRGYWVTLSAMALTTQTSYQTLYSDFQAIRKNALSINYEILFHSPLLAAANVTELLSKAIDQEPTRFATLESEALGFFNLMYFFTRLNTRLNDIYFLLSTAKPFKKL